MRTALIAALSRELVPTVSGWRSIPCSRRYVQLFDDGSSRLAAFAGIGAARAALAVEAALSCGDVDRLISVGLAGACDPALAVGTVLHFGTVVDAQSGERFSVRSDRKEVLVSTANIAELREKQRLRDTYGSSAVDMEAATVARLAHAHGLRFEAIKAISDESDFLLPALDQFTTSDGQFRETAFALHSAFRPRSWSGIITLTRNSGKAIRALTMELQSEEISI